MALTPIGEGGKYGNTLVIHHNRKKEKQKRDSSVLEGSLSSQDYGKIDSIFHNRL